MSVKGFNVNGVVEKYDYNELDNKPNNISADQGVANAGKILVVGNDGIVVPESLQSASGMSF